MRSPSFANWQAHHRMSLLALAVEAGNDAKARAESWMLANRVKDRVGYCNDQVTHILQD